MYWLTRWRQRLRFLLRRERASRDLEAELKFFVDHRTNEQLASGLSLGEARRSALQSTGNLTRIREACEEELGFPSLEAFGSDVREGMRSLARHPGVAMMNIAL